MIFRTITDDITGANRSISLLGLSLKNVRDIVNNIPSRGLGNALFHTPETNFDENAIAKYNKRIAAGIPAHKALAEASRNTNRETIALMESFHGAAISDEQLEEAIRNSTIAAKAQSAALKGVAIAGNLVAYALIAKGIDLAITAIDNYVHRAEYAIAAMKEAQEEITSSQSNLRESSSTISENRERFLELSKGVDRSSNNISLSDEDYGEYLAISNKIAEISPSLIQCYDAQGNALIRLGDNAKATSEMLDEVLQAEQDMAQQSLIDNIGNLADGIYYQIQEAEKSRKALENELHDYSFYEGIAMPENLIEDVNESTRIIRLDTSTGFTREQIDDLKSVVLSSGARAELDQFGESISFYAQDTSLVEKAIKDYYARLGETKQKEITAHMDGIRKKLQEEENTIRDTYGQMNPSLSAWAKNTYEYDYLDEPQQSLIDALIPNLDWQAIKEETGKELASDEEYEEYIKTNILDPLMRIPDEYQEDVNQKFAQLLAFEPGDIDIIDFVTELQDYLDGIGVTINLTPLLGNTEAVKSDYEQITTNAAQRFIRLGDKNYSRLNEERQALDDFAKENSIDTEAEIALWNQCLQESKTREQAMEKYLAQSGNMDSLSSADILSQLEALSEGLDQLGNIYADVHDKGEFDWSSILNNEGFQNTFRKFTEEYDNFIAAISNSPDDISACQSAFDDLASAYIYNSDALDDVTAETKDAAIAMLQQMGVANADEIVTNKLIAHKEALALKEQALALTKDGVTAASTAQINALLNEANASDTTRAYLFQLVAAEQVFNNTGLDVSGKISALGQLAAAYGQTAVAAKLAQWEQAAKDSHVQSSYSQADIKHLQEEIAANVSAPIQFKSSSAIDSSNSASSAAQQTAETFDWLETLISRVQRKITGFAQTVSAVWKNWSARSHAAAQEMSAITEEITAQQSAYDAYMAKANSTGLSSYYQELVRNGGLHIEDITDDTLKEQIGSFREWYEKALACSDAVQTLRDDLADLAQTRFDNVSKQFEEEISLIQHETAMLNARLDQNEARGYLAGGSYYTELIRLEQENIRSLENESAALQNALEEALGSGAIEPYSEEWYSMAGSIHDVREAIEDANTSLIEYRNSLRQLDWDIFDRMQGHITQISGESDFLMDLMGSRDLYQQDGSFHPLGHAAVGLHALNYNTYMSQADAYAQEILRMDRQLADDPYNTALLERRQELLELQRDSIQAAEDEKQSIRELVSDGYDRMLEALQDIMDKRKDALQAEKDLYDYQKSIAEQTQAISAYEKQLSAFSGDMSEETQSKIQQIKVSLEEARQELQESEYDRWLSDQEQLLDGLYNEAEAWVSQRLDDLNAIIREAIDNTNANAGDIRTALEALGEDVGYSLTPEMEKIWTTGDGISQVVSQYSVNFSSHATTVQSALAAIQSLIRQMADASQAQAGADISAAAQSTAAVTGTPAAAISTGGTSGSAPGSAAPGSPSGSSSAWGSWFVSRRDSYPKSKLNIHSSIVDRLKYMDLDSSFAQRSRYYSAMGGSGTYTGSASQNHWMLAQMEAHGYARGSYYIPYGQLAWTQEHGGEAVYRASDGALLTPLGQGDMVFTREMSERLWKLAQGSVISNADTPALPEYGLVNRTTPGDVTLQIDGIQMYGVNDPEQFIGELGDALSTNTRIRKILLDNTVGLSLGKNSLLSHSR